MTKRLLVYRLGSLGDTVVALPAFHLIRRHFPDYRITILTNFSSHGRAAPLATVLPSSLYDDLIEYPLGARKPDEISRLRAALVARRFDLVISLAEARGLWKSLRDYAFFKWLCDIPVVRGIPLRRADLSFRVEPASQLYRSETLRLLDRLKWLGEIDIREDKWWDLELSPEETATGQSLLRECGIREPIVAFSIGTKMDVKDWSQPNWRALLQRLSVFSADYSLVAVGAADERSRAQELLHLWSGDAANLCGRTSPRVSAAVLRAATVYVGHDSGPLHLAAAVGTPTVSMYSARLPPGIWYPRGDTNAVFYNQTPCAGCGLVTCEAMGKRCILGIGVDAVYGAVAAHLQRSSAVSVRPASRFRIE
jgi:heptosyltransferase III